MRYGRSNNVVTARLTNTMARITIEQIKKELEGDGWKCQSTEYKNLDTLMTFICHEGHEVTSTWKKIRKKRVCPVCSTSSMSNNANIAALPKGKGVYRTLGLDQSSQATGWSVYDDKKLVAYGVFNASKSTPLNRIVELCDWLVSMIDSWKPDLVGIEETQYNAKFAGGHNVFKLLSQVMGAVMITTAREKVRVETVLIPTWRKHCGVKGNKRADQKKSAQVLVKRWHDITVSDDESDAICIGKYFSDTFSTPVIGEEIRR